ncbi:MAG: helix-turn-helix domain-containing protein [Planctomycetaceae bacterium]
MANQISMSQKQSIAALHAQGVSNRQIAALLNLHRDTVNRHVRLLKAENRPEAPPGDFSGIPPVDTVQPGCADRFELAGSGEVAECSILRAGTSPAGAKAGEPASDVIWEETELIVPGAQPLLETGHGSFAEISQNQPEAPPPGMTVPSPDPSNHHPFSQQSPGWF